MLTDGLYVAKFQTPLGNGAGVVMLNGAKLRGGDSAILYSGTVSQDGDKVTAKISTTRHTNGNASVFGTDRVTIDLSGKSASDTATLSGRAAGVDFRVELHRVSD